MADPAPDYGPLFQAAGQTHDIDPLLLQAIQMHEVPSGDPHAVGPPNKSGELAQGVMQFLPSTAAKYGVNTQDPASSILGAGEYLADLRKATNDNLPAMLAHYGGGNATQYAKDVLGTYRQLQSSWGIKASPDDAADTASATSSSGPIQGGIKITEKAVPTGGGPGRSGTAEGASFTPPPQTPSDYSVSNQAGSRAAHPMAASQFGDQPPADFSTAVFGPKPATPPASAAPAPATAPSDFSTQVFGPTGTAQVTPQPDRAEDARATAAAQPAATTPPQPSWWETNVAQPWNAMRDPTSAPPMTYMLGQPLLQNIGAGLFGQGPRNVAQRANEWEQAADQASPTLAAIDRTLNAGVDTPIGRFSIGGTPEQLAATGNRLAAQTQAYRTQYGNSLPAAAGEMAGNLLATYPLAAIGWGARALGEAVPILRGTTEVANLAATPAAQNILTTPGEDWRKAGAEGAAGGLAVGGALGSVAGQLAPGVANQAVQDARNLGFNLTSGEAAGGLAKQVEDISQYLPFSGAAAKVAEHRGVINRVLTRNMGLPETPVLNQATLQTARANAGNLMDQIRNVTVDANRDPGVLNDLARIHSQADLQNKTAITRTVDNIVDILTKNGDTLPGDALHNLISRGGDIDNLIRTGDRAEKLYALDLRGALQNAASRTGDPTLYPGATAATRQAVNDFNAGRYYWKTIKTVEPLVDKTGSADDVTYAGLARRIEGTPANPNFDPRFSSNNTDMATLARVLRGPLAELKSSGTGRQLMTAGLFKTLAGEGGLGAGLAAFAPENFNSYLAAMVPTLATIGAGRISRYGPGFSTEFNPLAARVFGPAVATNPLLTGQQQ